MHLAARRANYTLWPSLKRGDLSGANGSNKAAIKECVLSPANGPSILIESFWRLGVAQCRFTGKVFLVDLSF
jgi:hypothetical protein